MNPQELLELKKSEDTVIFAHYYVDEDVQAIADYVGDSYSLAKQATKVDAQNIIMAGVYFMGETMKILNPDKNVYLPDDQADCPMAHMVTVEAIEAMREQEDDLAVVCYVNSTAEIKAHADCCCTSANAAQVLHAMEEKNIFFIPDGNLGTNLKDGFPEKNIICHDGHCPVHHELTEEEVLQLKKAYPDAPVLAHPECQPAIAKHADYLGSTSGIIKAVGQMEAEEYIILTEDGILYELQQRYPDKVFHTAELVCEGMKRVSLDDIAAILRGEREPLTVDEDVSRRAKQALDRMLAVCES